MAEYGFIEGRDFCSKMSGFKLKGIDRFSRWFDRMKEYGFEEDKDFTSVKSSTVVNSGAERELQDYSISVDMAKGVPKMSDPWWSAGNGRLSNYCMKLKTLLHSSNLYRSKA